MSEMREHGGRGRGWGIPAGAAWFVALMATCLVGGVALAQTGEAGGGIEGSPRNGKAAAGTTAEVAGGQVRIVGPLAAWIVLVEALAAERGKAGTPITLDYQRIGIPSVASAPTANDRRDIALFPFRRTEIRGSLYRQTLTIFGAGRQQPPSINLYRPKPWTPSAFFSVAPPKESSSLFAAAGDYINARSDSGI
ncbi:MAG: hypothetical protein NTV86_24100 [Planctomycetota bacterium]|nr:hypothetical protein [Planctomycetota bacterium]